MATGEREAWFDLDQTIGHFPAPGELYANSGIRQLIERLRNDGARIIIGTSSQRRIAVEIVESLSLSEMVTLLYDAHQLSCCDGQEMWVKSWKRVGKGKKAIIFGNQEDVDGAMPWTPIIRVHAMPRDGQEWDTAVGYALAQRLFEGEDTAEGFDALFAQARKTKTYERPFNSRNWLTLACQKTKFRYEERRMELLGTPVLLVKRSLADETRKCLWQNGYRPEQLPTFTRRYACIDRQRA